jgi:serine/threonine-protein kinase
MAPEQVRGASLDGRVDVFALGIVLWEMLTGRRLFFDADSNRTMVNVLEAEILPPSRLRSEIPRQLDEVVLRALERDPNARFPSAKAMSQALAPFLRGARIENQNLRALLGELFPAGRDSIRPRAVPEDGDTLVAKDRIFTDLSGLHPDRDHAPAPAGSLGLPEPDTMVNTSPTKLDRPRSASEVHRTVSLRPSVGGLWARAKKPRSRKPFVIGAAAVFVALGLIAISWPPWPTKQSDAPLPSSSPPAPSGAASGGPGIQPIPTITKTEDRATLAAPSVPVAQEPTQGIRSPSAKAPSGPSAKRAPSKKSARPGKSKGVSVRAKKKTSHALPLPNRSGLRKDLSDPFKKVR